jgi:hypothetical protein
VSVAATNFVWYHSTAEGTDRLVLLALADFADENGRCFGSWGKLQQKTRCGRSTIARSLSRLQDAGQLVMVEQGHRRLAGDGGEATRWIIAGVSEMGPTSGPVPLRDPSSVKLGPKWCQTGTPTIRNNKERNNTGADAPAPAITSPSPLIPAKVVSPPKKPKFDPSLISLPHGAGLANAWGEFAQHRREIKAPLTPTAASRIVADLAAVNEAAAVEALRKSVKHGWRGVFVDAPPDGPKVLHIPRVGPVQPSDAERRMLAMEALQAQRMEGAA